MREFWRGARAATIFLTRIPAGGFPYSPAEWRWSSAWFPAVGAAVGLAMAGVWVAARPAGPVAAALLAYGAGLLVTGALHEDGLADTADALGGATSREGVFEILKDSRIGSYGGLALMVSLGLRVSLLSGLSHHALAALVLSQSTARLPPVWMMVLMPYVTPATTSKSSAIVVPKTGQGVAATGLALGAAALVVFATGVRPWDAGLGLLGASSGAAVCAWRFHRRAGGITGDFLGAAEQVGECAVLLALAFRYPAGA